jgi:hypothetical protein
LVKNGALWFLFDELATLGAMYFLYAKVKLEVLEYKKIKSKYN